MRAAAGVDRALQAGPEGQGWWGDSSPWSPGFAQRQESQTFVISTYAKSFEEPFAGFIIIGFAAVGYLEAAEFVVTEKEIVVASREFEELERTQAEATAAAAAAAFDE